MVPALAQFADFGIHFQLGQRSLHDHLDLAGVHRLGQIIVGPTPHGFQGRGDASKAGHYDDGDVGVDSVGLMQHIQATHPTHFEVGEHHMDGFTLEQRQGPVAPCSGQHPIPSLRQGVGNTL
jgi:hypothetical protein